MSVGGDAIGDQLSEIESVIGTIYADVITGSAVSNQLAGGAGNDLLSGAAGDDTLTGGLGADKLWGGSGFDTISYAMASGETSAPVTKAPALSSAVP